MTLREMYENSLVLYGRNNFIVALLLGLFVVGVLFYTGNWRFVLFLLISDFCLNFLFFLKMLMK